MTETSGVVTETATESGNVTGPKFEAPVNSSVVSASKAVSKPSSSGSPQAPVVPNFPPPKTDKPRPHVCTTCTRSFARLEHLKRHERSHTKEKPFECQACTRCFARRDLLLRHQQKLHSTTTPSARPRNGRRESTAGVANSRVRKNSIASSTTPGMRPRANTLSHVDTSTLGMLAGGGLSRPYLPLHSHHSSFTGYGGGPNFGFRAAGASNHPSLMGLPRLDTTGLPMDLSSGLRTAPPYGGFGAEFDMDMIGFSQSSGNTINPHELHTPGLQGLGIDGPADYSQNPYSNMSASHPGLDDDGSFDWMAHGFENQMSFANANTNEQAIDDSSPSVMSTNSPAAFQEIHRQNSLPNNQMSKMENVWQQTMSSQAHMMNSPMSMEMNTLFTDMVSAAEHTISPKSLLAQTNAGYEINFPTPPDLSMDPAAMAAMSNGTFSLPFKHDTIASTASTASMDSSMRHSSITTNCADFVNDHLRNSLISALSLSTSFGQRRQSVPAVSSPLSPSGGHKSKGFNPSTFPSTQDLQKYVSAYIRYCHPHLPFLHLPTLNFESSEYQISSRAVGSYQPYGQQNLASGGSCLMLSMAAMGALYEHDINPSKELFEHAKRLINSYLEGRRKSGPNRSSFMSYQTADTEDTPLWLVQAMLLNVVYGHNCGDKTAADIASNHCAALVSLARGAELAKPYTGHTSNTGHNQSSGEAWGMMGSENGEADWLEWKNMEERKRTLYSVFVLSSMLVMAYNRAPTLTNSEIRLDLPCDEELWAADNAQAWRALGGAHTALSRSIPFAGALTHLLTAAQRERQAAEQKLNSDAWQQLEAQNAILKPSSFGCLVLIDALHNYIWETRQRHLGRQWTTQEVEAMHAHIEPALRAWTTAWSSNPLHVIERPNPFGAGPLPADSIPLLDLAYVRLFVDFGRSKEAYWQRDYDAMAHELAKGPETGYGNSGDNVSTMQRSPGQTQHSHNGTRSLSDGSPGNHVKSEDLTPESPSSPTRRERHLRKAAFYAADHLVNADRLGMAFAEQTSRELPMQSILCACDCAQVLSEWVTTLQERVGKHLGIIGTPGLEVGQLSGSPLLDEEDRKLLGRIEELLAGAEQRSDGFAALEEARLGGFASRILVLTSQNMSRAAVWPVTKLMAQSLETQAAHVQARVLASM